MKSRNQTPKKIKVLLADDDADDRIIFREAFTQLHMDIDVDIARHGEDALEYLENTSSLPDLLFLDLNMPIMNGMDCLRHIRQNNSYKNMPVIIYSTSQNEEEVEQTRALGANAYIKKPNSFENLKTILYRLVSEDLQTGKYPANRAQASA